MICVRVLAEVSRTYFSAAKSLSKSPKFLRSPYEVHGSQSWKAQEAAKQKRGAQRCLTHLDKGHILALIASELLHPFIRDLKCVIEVVDDGHLAPLIQQAEKRVTACIHR